MESGKFTRQAYAFFVDVKECPLTVSLFTRVRTFFEQSLLRPTFGECKLPETGVRREKLSRSQHRIAALEGLSFIVKQV